MPHAQSEQMQLEEALADARRELYLRRVNYPRWVEQGSLSSTKAENQIRVQRWIVDYLGRQLRALEGQGELWPDVPSSQADREKTA